VLRQRVIDSENESVVLAVESSLQTSLWGLGHYLRTSLE
jgi:hypothetical protein